ncbi:hypothetical protein N7G274_005772 [Stereocaulon virgatum]|uniref:Uncharacterized protein n=1 Tax=Stereocaulon virgatum TaxID=373712 RepID=A0ABR4A6E4_9LECA
MVLETIAFIQKFCDDVGFTLTISTSTPTITPSVSSTPEPAFSTAFGLSVSSAPNVTVKATPAITITASPNSRASISSQSASTGASPRHCVHKFRALAIVVAAAFPMI